MKTLSIYMALFSFCILTYVFFKNPLTNNSHLCDTTNQDVDCVQGLLQEVAGLGILIIISFLLLSVSIFLYFLSKRKLKQ